MKPYSFHFADDLTNLFYFPIYSSFHPVKLPEIMEKFFLFMSLYYFLLIEQYRHKLVVVNNSRSIIDFT